MMRFQRRSIQKVKNDPKCFLLEKSRYIRLFFLALFEIIHQKTLSFAVLFDHLFEDIDGIGDHKGTEFCEEIILACVSPAFIR